MSGPCGYDRNTLKRHFVYICTDAEGVVIYVGRTSDMNRRMYEHSRNAPWWDLLCDVTAHLKPSIMAANQFEQALIRELLPKFNNDYVPRDGQ